MIPRLKRDTRIPRKPFLWLTAAFVFTIPPMFGALAAWVPTLFLAVLAAKFWMEPRDYRLRWPVWKLLLGAVAVVVVFFTYGSVEGIEPGVSIVVTLTALKILEAHTAREFQVMVHVGWILCLCGFFLSQDLATAVCELIAFTLLLVALIEFHGQSPAGSVWVPLGAAFKILVSAIPLIVLLFVLFPRVNVAMRMQMATPNTAGAGFSGELSPGSVSSLANSSEIAFRAEFPDGRIPRADRLYWRGVVLSRGNGLDWPADPPPDQLRRPSRLAPQGIPVRQSITIEPHGNRWMFALDWPAEAPPGCMLAPGNYLWSSQTIRTAKKYDVVSFPETRGAELRPRERINLLEVPSWISQPVRELARSWTDAGGGSAAVVKRGLDFFRAGDFRYSLTPGQYGNTDLEEFLFHRRVGFCEHYAATFATLMRLAGIPARVVVGYLGGEYNEWGNFFVIRQSDSHAWCEVWLPPNGWIRVDPTSVVAPDRVTLGFNSFLERRATTADKTTVGRGLVRDLARLRAFNSMRLAWQAVNYAWDTRVLSFDQAAQTAFFSSFGDFGDQTFTHFAAGMASMCVVLALYFGWMRVRNRQPRDLVKESYRNFCQKLMRLGASRQPAEGPADFATRAAGLLPDKSDQIQTISNLYIDLRYSQNADGALRYQFVREVKAFG